MVSLDYKNALIAAFIVVLLFTNHGSLYAILYTFLGVPYSHVEKVKIINNSTSEVLLRLVPLNDSNSRQESDWASGQRRIAGWRDIIESVSQSGTTCVLEVPFERNSRWSSLILLTAEPLDEKGVKLDKLALVVLSSPWTENSVSSNWEYNSDSFITVKFNDESWVEVDPLSRANTPDNPMQVIVEELLLNSISNNAIK